MANDFVQKVGDSEESDSLFRKTGQALTVGLADAVVSAGTSFYNTGVALGNAFGGEGEQVATEDVIDRTIGSNAADYYAENKTAVDTAGLVIGSFIPGLGSVKAAKLASQGLLATRTSRLATGIRQAMLPEERLNAIEYGIKTMQLGDTLVANRKKLIAGALLQNFAESAIYETATLLTMNQSSSLNAEGLGYFDSITNNLDTAAIGTVIGTGIGGVAGYFSTKSALRTFLRDQQLDELSKLKVYASPLGTDVGDQVSLHVDNLVQTQARLDELSKLPALDRAPFAHEIETHKSFMTATENKIIETLNKNSLGDHDYGSLLVGALKENNIPVERWTDSLMGATSLRAIKPTSAAKGVTGNVVNDEVADLPSLFVERYLGMDLDKAAGVARLKDDLFSAGKLPDQEAEDLFLDSAGLLEADDIKFLWGKSFKKRVTIRNPDGKAATIQDLTPAELAKFNLPKRGAAAKSDKLTTMIDVREHLMELAEEYDPVYRDLTANLKTSLDELTTKLNAGEITKGERAERIGELMDNVASMNHPTQLFATAYRMFNKAELDPALAAQIAPKTGKYRALYEYMTNNKAISARYGSTKAVMRLQDGMIVNKIPAAFPSDFGKLEIRNGTVRSGDFNFQMTPETKLEDLSPTEAQAAYAWASSLRGAARDLLAGDHKSPINPKWANSLSADNLPVMEGLLHHYSWQYPLMIKNLKGESVEVGSQFELLDLIREAKSAIPNRFAGKTTTGLTDHELAMYANVDEKYYHAMVVGNRVKAGQPVGQVPATGTGAPWDQGEEFFANSLFTVKNADKAGADLFEEVRPVHVELNYNKQAFDRLGVRGTDVALAAGRLQAQQNLMEGIGRKILGVTDAELPSLKLGKRGEVTSAVDSTAQDTTSGVVTSTNPDYLTAQSIYKARGDIMHRLQAKDDEAIEKGFESAVVALKAKKEAEIETSILLQSTLRQDNYMMLPDTKFLLSAKESSYYKALGIDLDKLLESEVYAANGMSINNPAGHLITEELGNRVSHVANKIRVNNEDLKMLELAVRTGPSDQFSLLSQLAQEAQKKVQATIADMRNLFSSAASDIGSKQVHEIMHPETAQFIRTMVDMNKKHLLSSMEDLAAAHNRPHGINPDVIYPGAFNTKRYPSVAFVKLKSGATNPWAAKSEGMLFASTDEELKRKIGHFYTKVSPDDVDIVTYGEKIDRIKAQMAYDAQLALSDTHVNSFMKKDGKLWDVAPEYNPQAITDYLSDFKRQRGNMRIAGMKLVAAPDIQANEFLHKVMTTRSATGAAGKQAEKSAFEKNINLMLGLKASDNHGWWHDLQEKTDQAISKQVNWLRGAWFEAHHSGDWAKVGETLKHYGLPELITGEEDFIASNMKAAKPEMAAFVGKVNYAFSYLMLKLDAAHSLVNAVSMPIMSNPEISSLVQSFEKMTPERAKALQLVTSAPYNKLGERMPTNMKLMAQAVRNLFNPERYDQLVERGLINHSGKELQQLIDAVSIQPAGAWKTGVDKALTMMGKPADFTETQIKAISADMARQVLDLAGVSQEHPLYWSTVHTFMSRAHGNYTAAQRPTMFQGWMGQGLGLFQTYQFNLIQQFTKHLGDGGKAARQMMAAQTAIFGAQSLPGFQWVNQYLGEKTLADKDIYSVTGETLDTPVAEFLLYGGASSFTRPLFGGKGIDLFSRGSLQPRTPILIPTSFDEVPAVSFLSNAISLAANTFDALGKDVGAKNAFLEALAHNGMNRPIAGAAQLMLGQRTTKNGTTLVNYADWDYATAITKLMGTHTLDEGIAVGSMYRAQGYRAARLEELNDLASGVRMKVREGTVTQSDIQKMMADYVAKGGNQRTFNRWMQNQFAHASESAVSTMRESLNSPEGLYLQKVLGNRVDQFDRTAIDFGSLPASAQQYVPARSRGQLEVPGAPPQF